ncbi:MAG: hypothetical protein ACFFER_10960 [Candidatus Thorarchaeota archaeon]
MTKNFSIQAQRRRIKEITSDTESLAFLILLFFITIVVSISLSGYVGSTNHDAATHTFYTRIILEQQKIPLTAEPFNSYVMSYPLGVHTVLASLVVIGSPIYSVVILSTALLPGLSAMAAYSISMAMFKSHNIAILSGIIAGLSSRTITAPLSWGGITSGLANVLLLVLLGFTYRIFVEKQLSSFDLIISAMITGLMPWLHPAAAVPTLCWCGVGFIAGILFHFQKRSDGNNIRIILKRWIVYVSISFAVLVPYLLRLIYSLSIPNQGYPIDVPNLPSTGLSTSAQALLSFLDFNYLLDMPSLSFYASSFGLMFWILPFALIAIPVELMIRKSDRYSRTRLFSNPKGDGSLPVFPTIILYVTMLVYLTFLRYVIPAMPSGSTITVAIQAITVRLFYEANLLMIPLVAFALGVAFEVSRMTYLELVLYTRLQKKNRQYLIACCTVLLLSSSAVVSVIPSTIGDLDLFYSRVRTSQSTYNTLTIDDVNLMLWMAENLPETSVILVGYNDAGEYVSAVTGFPTIYEYAERIRSSTNYNELLRIMTENPLNSSAIPLLESFEITHIFVGANPLVFSSGQLGYTFNATDLLRSPWIQQVGNFGNATLMRFAL